ncbi:MULTISPECIES: lipid-A-disaccharide synthase-related protein [Synechococcales]|uniref:lipid-A-disaccharide synthase-related protein n=1 Tax=Synechococcus sp. CS-1333 TaxID=2848638 RepID=UPI00223BADDC|nr:lipid-A-disaccharide synthase-related protein [Synechococcus sp. CS-1333]MCT0210860.1 lipid-A-disaccharide synthase-related protein [Synechococcus sp. CS-1333]
MPSRLLVLSNGHGEDLIALKVIEALQQRQPGLGVCVLPLVGEGQCFAAAEAAGALQRIGPRQRLPSGGFSNQSLSGLVQDLVAGLPQLSWGHLQTVRRWGRTHQPLLAVGDLLPLALAWSSGAPFAFIGTPKSDYTWRSGPGHNGLADGYHRCKGSEWDPWEWALMGSRRCRLVAVRDGLTARGLRRHGVPALAPGNPMMDGLAPTALPAALASSRRLVLLCGSRLPEAIRNFERLLSALQGLAAEHDTLVFCPIGATPAPEQLGPALRAHGFQPVAVPGGSGADQAWRRGAMVLLLGRGCFPRWAGWGELGLATAGTATEQFVGLGLPALSLPGPGPQFKRAFARRQSRLLGGAVQVCASPGALTRRLRELLQDPVGMRRLGQIGRRRMGSAGGSERLAALLERQLLAGGRG